jgi:SulP family sulfate permease
LTQFVRHAREMDPWAVAAGVATLAAALIGRRVLPRVPYMLTGMIGGALFAYVLARNGIARVPTIGALPSALPPLSMPEFSAASWRTLAPAALALTVIGLTEAVSSARAVAARSGQHLDGNQEFIGQGLANIAGAFTSSYPTSGSFNRTGANYEAGAKTGLAALFSAFVLLVLVASVAPLASYIPLAVMAALLFLVAWGLIDGQRIREIVRIGRGEALVMAVTFLSTLLLQLEFAILVGVLCSLLMYLKRTTHPAIHAVAPDPSSPLRRFEPVADTGSPECPQLALLRLDGSLFFGAVDHVHEELDAVRTREPQKRVLLIGSGVNFIDAAGGELLVREAQRQRERGGVLYLANLKPAAREVLERGGFLSQIGHKNVFATKTAAIAAIYGELDTDVCRACRARIFNECARLPDGSERRENAD